MSTIHRRALAILAASAVAVGGVAAPVGARTSKHWSSAKCTRAYSNWAKKHKKATARQKRTERSRLHKRHGCSTKVGTKKGG